MKKCFLLLYIPFLLLSCNSKTEIQSQDALKEEGFKAEDNFKNFSQTKGIAAAFYTFADENAVIKRFLEICLGLNTQK